MKPETISLCKELLFAAPSSNLKTYAIVDSIRDKKVNEKILFSGLRYLDLWHEELFENEQKVPLYLIELEKDNELIEYLMSQHKESIATYLISPYSIEALQAYYSMFTHVNIEAKEDKFQKGIFGFYDPNILANYIQTLYTQDKIDEFFAGTTMWLTPNTQKEDELYLAYRTKEGEVEDVNLQLSNLIEEENPSLNFDDVSLPTIANLEEYAHEVDIDYTQVKMFDNMEKIKFIDNVFKEYAEEGCLFYHHEDFCKQRALGAFDEAKQAGLVSESGLYHYILLGTLTNQEIQNTVYYKRLLDLHSEEQKIEYLKNTISAIVMRRRRSDGI